MIGKLLKWLHYFKRVLNQTQITVRPLFNPEATKSSTANAEATPQESATMALPSGVPLKRMISKKALLSRLPISSSISPKTHSASSSDKSRSPSAYRGDLQRDISHSNKPIDYTSSANRNPSSSLSTSVKAFTSSWTGKTLGSDNRNASSVSRCAIASSSAATNLDSNRGGNNNKPSSTEQAHATSDREPTAEEEDAAIRADVLPTLAKLGKTNSLVVNPKQRGNPILNFVKNVPWEFGNIVPDYVMGQSNCALYLSLRYHQLHPEYVHQRLKLLGRSYDLRVLLVQVDIKDPHHLLKELAKICILADCTLMLAFSAEEAGRYLETYKVYEHKPAEAIMEQTESNFSAQLTDCLTRVKAINKTDCATLLATFGNLQGIMKASAEDLSLCPGFGPQKAKRLHDVFREPFLVSKKQRTDIKK